MSSISSVIYEAVQAAKDDAPSILADVVFTQWHTGYIAKSEGHTDEFGNDWPPLAQSTLDKKAARVQGGWRDADRIKQWESRQQALRMQLMRAGMSVTDAHAKATELAWLPVAMTASGIPINVDTTRLEQSLSPEGGEGQIREVEGDVVRLGTEVVDPETGEEYAHHVNKQRRIKPTAEELSHWVKVASDVIRNRIMGEIARRA